MNYEEILKESDKLKKVKIDDKEYTPVSERLKFYWTKVKNGKIETDIVYTNAHLISIKARIYEDEKLIASGHSIRNIGNLEICETLAIGRALANAGIAIKDAIASADEMIEYLKNKIYNNQNVENKTSKKLSDTQKIALDEIKKLKQENNLTEIEVKEAIKILFDKKKFNDLSDDEVDSLIEYLDNKVKEDIKNGSEDNANNQSE